MVEYCSKCHGNKKYRGMGHVLVTCDICKGKGIKVSNISKISSDNPEPNTTDSVIDKPNSVINKPKRGRPKKEDQV